MRLKSSSINSSDTSAKYSWPSREQKEAIQDSGSPDVVDMVQYPVGNLRSARGGLERRFREAAEVEQQEIEG